MGNFKEVNKYTVDFHFARLTAYSGFRLCVDTYEKAKYFGRQFLDLWSEYFTYDFIIKRI